MKEVRKLVIALAALVLLVSSAGAEPMANGFGVNDSSGDPNTFVKVPVNISNVHHESIAGIVFDISFDSSVINLTKDRVQKGDLTAAWDFAIFNPENGRISIVLNDTGTEIPIGGSGSVVILNFSVVGVPGATSVMNVSRIQISGLGGALGNASARNSTFTITTPVMAGIPIITNFTPTSEVIDVIGAPTRTFTINVNQTINVSWQINGTEVSNETNVNSSLYSNTSAAPGIWNVSAFARNANGSDIRTWIWKVTQPTIGNGSISGMKFNDSNGNGIKDTGETGLAGWAIVLTGGSTATMTTDANGSYTFSNMAQGNYTVAEVIKPDWKQTLPVNGTYNITISSGENLTGMDFGNYLPVTPPVNVTEAFRIIEKESLHPGESTNITVDISSNISQAMSLHEIIPAGWDLIRISDDADAFKNSTSESIWSNVSPGINKTVIYRLTAPDNASIGTYHINGTISGANGVIAVVQGDNTIILNLVPPQPSVVNATRQIEKASLRPGESTNITIRISSNMNKALALQELIPGGWNLTRISGDADAFNSRTSEWIWFNVSPGINKTVIYRLTAPDNASTGTYHINGTISSKSGVIAVVQGDNSITFDITAFYRRLGSDTNRVETTDVLTATDDWRNKIAPAGFERAITTQELLALIDEWVSS